MEWKALRKRPNHTNAAIGKFSLMESRAKKSLSVIVVGGMFALAPQSPAFAQGYDMDCKVILCLAGGFPSDCGDAWDYMIDRITDFPKPKPPFGVCSQDDGSPYEAVDAPYAYLRERQASGWHCGEGTKLFHRVHEEDHGQGRVEAFCYTHTTDEWQNTGDDRRKVTVYHGKKGAKPVNFQIRVTVEPGTPDQYTSPLYKLNYNTGFVAQIP